MVAQTKTSWRMAGEEFKSCNCAWGCPCDFNMGIVSWQSPDDDA